MKEEMTYEKAMEILKKEKEAQPTWHKIRNVDCTQAEHFAMAWGSRQAEIDQLKESIRVRDAEVERLKELILKKDAMLEDIIQHTVKPFEGEKWMNYLKYIAEEALKLTEESNDGRIETVPAMRSKNKTTG